MKKALFSIAILSILFFISTGCSNTRLPEVEMMSIIDMIGREVEVPVDAQRIAVLNSYLLEIMIALDVDLNRVVAIDSYSQSGRSWVYTTGRWPALMGLPSPEVNNEINVETMLSVNPDLILSVVIGEGAFSRIEPHEHLFDAPIVVFDLQSITTYNDNFELLAQIVDAKERSDFIINIFNDMFESLDAALENIELQDRVRVYHALSQPTNTLNANIFQSDQIVRAGGINVAAYMEGGWGGLNIPVTVEQIIEWSPDVIVMLYECPLEAFTEDARFAPIPAIVSGRVYRHPESGWGFASPRAIYAIKWLSVMFYPELFSDTDIASDLNVFYETLFGFPFQN